MPDDIVQQPYSETARYTTTQSEQIAALRTTEATALANRQIVLNEQIAIGVAAGKTRTQATETATASSEFLTAQQTYTTANRNANAYIIDQGTPTTTYYDAQGNPISKARYDGLLKLQAASNALRPDDNRVGGDPVPPTLEPQTVAESLERNANNFNVIDFGEDGTPIYFTNGNLVSRNEFIANGGVPIKTAEELADEAFEAEFDTAIAEEEENIIVFDALEEQRAELARQRENDWRVRLHLAPGADYLYNATDAGILAPLKETNGLIFPYTPQIQVQYNAAYENYDLVHSNYRGYFYTGSQVQNIIFTATFTANDLREANYLLAAMHFLRSATKMFYGQDDKPGMPPPIVFLSGLGEYQFNNHPCAITSVHYNLPDDVDYIPCGKVPDVAPIKPPTNPPTSTPEARRSGSAVGAGGRPPQSGTINSAIDANGKNPYTKATYVPTKIDINFTMIPIQTRDQVSKEFSLRDYANGSLLTKGFW